MTASSTPMAGSDVGLLPADREAADKAFDIAFRGDTVNIDADMAGLFAAHRKAAQAELTSALGPFAAMGRVMEARAAITFGRIPKDTEIVCESSGEAGVGILTMGHFRDAAALLPNAPGWGGQYQPAFDRTAITKATANPIDTLPLGEGA